MNNPKLYILIGPPASGKSYAGDYLLSQGIEKIVTTTDREKREGEIDGIDYYFVTSEEFQDIPVVEKSFHYGIQYGLSHKEYTEKLLQSKQSFVILSEEGMHLYKKLFSDVVDIEVIYFIIKPSVMLERLLKRKDVTEAYRRLDESVLRGEFNLHGYADHMISGLSKDDTRKALNYIIGGE